MDNQTAINFLDQLRKVLLDDKSWLKSTTQPINEAFDKAISALRAQDSKTKRCATCKHDPPSKKWPCVDCDMRESADRWEPKEEKNSTQEAKNLTQKGLDTISRRVAIDTEGLDEEVRCAMCRNQMKTDRGCDGNCKYDEKLYEKIMQILDERIKPLPSAQPTLHGYNIEHLELIARVLQKEDLPPERIVEALTDIGRIVAIFKDEFEEALRKAVEQCTM